MKLLFLLGIIMLMPQFVWAGELFFEIGTEKPAIGEDFIVTVYINNQEPANTISSEVLYDVDTLTLERVTTRDSLITFWINRPKEREAGIVSFSGIVPGGFVSTKAAVVDLHFSAHSTGTSRLHFSEALLLAHDGHGTALSVSGLPLEFEIDNTPTQNAEVLIDTRSPESFSPELVQREDWFEGKAVLVFSATDKESGVQAYYIKETPYRFFRWFSSWRLVTSPYVIQDQKLRNYIIIRAEDGSGNKRDVEVLPQNPHLNIWYWIVLLVLIVGYKVSRKIIKSILRK